MKTSAMTWAEALNISPENLSAWGEEAPAGMPLLVFCLREGKIPLEEYLEWAVEAYGLPQLSNLFFNEAFYPEQMTDLSENDSWTPWFFPVARWDDVVTIACVEPLALEGGIYSYVLADPSVLVEMFQRFQAGTAMAPAPEEAPAIPDVPVGMTLETKKFTLNFDEQAEESPAMEPSLQLVSPEQETAIRPPPPPSPLKAKPAASAGPKPADLVMDTAFEEIKKEYQTALVMQIEDGVAFPYRWHRELAEVDPIRARVDLTVPSMFRIVTRTLQPYHGYTVASQVHEDFFASLNLIVFPSCVTAVPIMVGGEIWGILLALGAESALGSDPLNHVREAADRLGRALNGDVPTHQAA